MLNYELLKEKMKEKNLDAIVAMSPENVLYSTGSWLTVYKLLRDRLAIVLLPIDKDPVFIVCGIEENLVSTETWIKDIRPYIEFQEYAIDFLIDAVKENNIEQGKIGIEKGYFPIEHFDKLNAGLPDAAFTDCRKIFEELRMIKSEDEIKRLGYAAKSTRKAIDAAFLSTQEGDSERDLANRIRSNIFELGADELTFFAIGVGERGKMAHPTPGDFPLKKGETVRLDVGALFRGYNSDVARTACIGHPNETQTKIYRSIMEAYREVIDSMKVGAKFCDLYNMCKEGFESRGLTLLSPHIGHSLGIDLHENPMISPVNQNSLEEGMAICLEPFYRSPEGYGYHVEDLILIHRDGPKILTESNLSDEISVIG